MLETKLQWVGMTCMWCKSQPAASLITSHLTDADHTANVDMEIMVASMAGLQNLCLGYLSQFVLQAPSLNYFINNMPFYLWKPVRSSNCHAQTTHACCPKWAKKIQAGNNNYPTDCTFVSNVIKAQLLMVDWLPLAFPIMFSQDTLATSIPIIANSTGDCCTPKSQSIVAVWIFSSGLTLTWDRLSVGIFRTLARDFSSLPWLIVFPLTHPSALVFIYFGQLCCILTACCGC